MSTIYCTRFRKTSPRENKVNTFLSFYQKYILIKPWFSNATQHLLGKMVANNHTTHLCTESLVALVRNMTRGLIPGFSLIKLDSCIFINISRERFAKSAISAVFGNDFHTRSFTRCTLTGHVAVPLLIHLF